MAKCTKVEKQGAFTFVRLTRTVLSTQIDSVRFGRMGAYLQDG